MPELPFGQDLGEYLDIGVHRGIDWCICPCNLDVRPSINGYVYIMDTWGVVDLGKLDVHGRITYGYADSESWTDIAFDGRWIGFDTGQFRDYWPPEYLRNTLGLVVADEAIALQDLLLSDGFSTPIVWSLDMVRDETIALVDQVANIAATHKVSRGGG